ncbi:MAG: glycosyltransferase family 4 protein [Planctomycetaceae bacterium]
MSDAAAESSRRVLLLSGVFEVRGSSASTLRLAERLPEHGFEPLLVCRNADRVSRERFHRLAIREYRGLATRVIGLLARRLLAHDFQDEPPALIHAQSRFEVAVGNWLARIWDRPLVVSVHGFLHSREQLTIDRRHGCRVMAVSPAVRDGLLEQVNLPEDKVVVVPGGVDPPQVARLVSVLDPDHVPVVGTAGPLEVIKGLPFFLGAAQKVLATGRDVEFLVAGAGPEEINLRRLAVELGIGERVTFLPNRPDFSDALAAIDVFCLPSLQQGLGTIMLEAMSLGRPVIASAVGGVYSVVRDAETGLVVPPRDSGALALRILELLDDPARSRAIGEAGREAVEKEFGILQMVERSVAVYREVIEESTSGVA